jgi:hypothetical protein
MAIQIHFDLLSLFVFHLQFMEFVQLPLKMAFLEMVSFGDV